MNQDVYYNIFMMSDINSIKSLCSIKLFSTLCNDSNFWKAKIKYDFGITNVGIIPTSSKEWLFLYHTIQKVMAIDKKNFDFTFRPTDDVLSLIDFIFNPNDIDFIAVGEEYDFIVEQFIRIAYKADDIYIQYTGVGERDYYTIYTHINQNTLINILIIILYHYPNVKIN